MNLERGLPPPDGVEDPPAGEAPPPARRRPVFPPGGGGDDELFASAAALAPRGPLVTFREAVLTSLLAHAVAVIAILLAPPRLIEPPATAVRLLRTAEEEPVHMTFVQDRARPAQPNPDSRNASDRDRRRAQEEPPRNPSKIEPYARGNTPAQIAGGPLAPPGPPLDPRPAPEAAPPPPGDPEARRAGRADAAGPAAPGEAPAAGGAVEAREGTGPFYVPPRGGGGGDDPAMRAKGERLREALARMGAAGASGAGEGVRFRYDNPTGGLATPTGSLSFDTKGFDWGPYARKIYWIIWSNWHARMPPAVYAGLKGQVTVHFVIHRDGRISDIEVLSSSGIPAYDSAAVLALEASSPLPPLPETFPGESDGVTGRFLYNIWEPE